MNAILHETQPFSNIEVYSFYSKFQKVIIEANENYQKRSLRNKYFILTSQGILSLTIPLKSGKNHQKPIRDVQISYDENWSKIHQDTLKTAYGKSPFFEHYFEDLESLFSKKYKFLYDFNMESIQCIIRHIRIPIEIKETVIYEKNPDSEIGDYRNHLWSPPLELINPDWKYIQVWTRKQEFYYNLSILDMLFNCGPFSAQLLKTLIL